MLGIGVTVLLLAAGIYLSLRLAQALDRIDALDDRLQQYKAFNLLQRRAMLELESELEVQRDANRSLLRLVEIKDRLLENAYVVETPADIAEVE